MSDQGDVLITDNYRLTTEVLLFNKLEEVKNVPMCDDIGAGFLIASKMRFGSSRAELQQTL